MARIDTPVSWTSFSIERQDLAPHRGVEGRHRLVGHDQPGLQGHGPGDDHPLALAAGDLVGIAQEEVLRRPQAADGHGLGDPFLLDAVQALDADALGHGLVDRLAGVQRPGGVLEHHLHGPAVGLGATRADGDGLALEADLAGEGLLQADDRPGQRGLAAARLPDERHDLPLARCRGRPRRRPGRPRSARRAARSSSSGAVTSPPLRAGRPGCRGRRRLRGPGHGPPQLHVGRGTRPQGVGAAGVERAAARAGGSGSGGSPPRPLGRWRSAGSPMVGKAAASARV